MKKEDLLGNGKNEGGVYSYNIKNHPIAVKIFTDENEAEIEKNNLEKIEEIASGYPGIVQYYGMKKL